MKWTGLKAAPLPCGPDKWDPDCLLSRGFFCAHHIPDVGRMVSVDNYKK